MLTLRHVVIDIRDCLEKAIEEKNQLIDERVVSTLDLILDLAYKHNETQQAIILEDLIYSANHIGMSVWFKAKGGLPGVEEIELAFLPA